MSNSKIHQIFQYYEHSAEDSYFETYSICDALKTDFIMTVSVAGKSQQFSINSIDHLSPEMMSFP